jgi:hypothetical protein
MNVAVSAEHVRRVWKEEGIQCKHIEGCLCASSCSATCGTAEYDIPCSSNTLHGEAAVPDKCGEGGKVQNLVYLLTGCSNRKPTVRSISW